MNRTIKPRMLGIRKYCLACLPEWFGLPFAGEQLGALTKVSHVAMGTRPGMHALAMESGDGKSTILAAAALWATFQGLRRFPILLVASDRVQAVQQRIAAALALETHGREFPFFPQSQVMPIGANLGGITRPAFGLSRPATPSSGLVALQTPDMYLFDDPPATADVLKVLNETFPAMPVPGKPGRKPPALLLGAPALVAKLVGWQAA